MGSIAKRLGLGASAGAPQIALPRLDLVVVALAIGNQRRGLGAAHGASRSTPSAPRRSACGCVGRGAPDSFSIVTPNGQLAGAMAIKRAKPPVPPANLAKPMVMSAP